jgi:hypothetical protein
MVGSNGANLKPSISGRGDRPTKLSPLDHTRSTGLSYQTAPSAAEPFVWEDAEPQRPRSQARRTSRPFLDRYQGLPSWALLIQIFLAAGWGRAALAHALSRGWWTGAEIEEFVAAETDLAIGLYRPVLDGPVLDRPAATAAVVLVAELIVAVMLALNVRAAWALAIGAFLNVQFISAGVVNPSIFYLVAALAIVFGRLESRGPLGVRRRTQIAAVLGAIAIPLLVPWVRTVRPDQAIEDPALVLIFLTMLAVGGQLWVYHLNRLSVEARSGFYGEDDGEMQSLPGGSPTAAWFAASMLVALSVLIVGFVIAGATGGG